MTSPEAIHGHPEKESRPLIHELGTLQRAYYSWRIQKLVLKLKPGLHHVEDNSFSAQVHHSTTGKQVEIWEDDGTENIASHIIVQVFGDQHSIGVNAIIDDGTTPIPCVALNLGPHHGYAADPYVPQQVVRALRAIPS